MYLLIIQKSYLYTTEFKSSSEVRVLKQVFKVVCYEALVRSHPLRCEGKVFLLRLDHLFYVFLFIGLVSPSCRGVLDVKMLLSLLWKQRVEGKNI